MLVFYCYDEHGDHFDTVEEKWMADWLVESCGGYYEEVFRADLG